MDRAKKKFSQEILNTLRVESLVLCRCIYRMNLQFRNDKGFKYMQKTNSLLKKVLNFDILSDFNYFYCSVPQKYDKDMYMPTRQMLEYLLVRLQGYSQLASRVCESAQTTVEFMRGRLILGHLWVTAAVNLSLASRIWQLCKDLTENCCVLFDDLLPLRENLIPIGGEWLEKGYEFPVELKVWLDMDWLKDQSDVVSHVQLELPIFNLIDDEEDDDVEFCYQYKLNDFITVEDDDAFNEDDVEIIAKYTTESNNLANRKFFDLTNQNKNNNFFIPDSDSSCDLGVAVAPSPKSKNIHKNKIKKFRKAATINLISPVIPNIFQTQLAIHDTLNSSNVSPDKKRKKSLSPNKKKSPSKKRKKKNRRGLNMKLETQGRVVDAGSLKGSSSKKRKRNLSQSKKNSPSAKKRKKKNK